MPIVLLSLTVASIAIGSATLLLQDELDRQSQTDASTKAHNVAVAGLAVSIAQLKDEGSSTPAQAQQISGHFQEGDYVATITPNQSKYDIAIKAHLQDGTQASVQVVFDLQKQSVSDWREQP
ncbi:MAG: competence type IV pilus minor pilin ComGG [Firmicutes bacterium]|nr:competence type IV pilus minor pilin ComGG [Bacillota bacterium]